MTVPLSRSVFLGVLLPLLLVSSCILPLDAQDGRGTIRGRVLSEGQPIAGAVVELLGSGAEAVLRRTQADAAGEYHFFALPSGQYRLQARAPGYRMGSPVPVRLSAGEVQTLSLSLSLAPVELEEVAVTSTRRVQIDRATTEFSTQLKEEEIRLLPAGYDPTELVAFTPGARAGHVWGGATQQANNYQLDGLAANHPGVGGDLIQPSIGWVESIEVVGLGAGAEHGNFQGGLINIRTKSGGNRFQGALRSSAESHLLNASNLGEWDIGSEIRGRYDLEGEVRGPLVKDRLFYFLAGQWTERDARHVNHLKRHFESPFLPSLEERSEGKFFGKVTWQPTRRDRVDFSAGAIHTTIENYAMRGFEAPGAALRYRAPTSFYSGIYRRTFAGRSAFEVKVAGFARDETQSPYDDEVIPSVQFYGLRPPFATFRNAPVRLRHAPESRTGSAALDLGFQSFGAEHLLKVGAEHTQGSFTNERLRTGGMTWRPPRLARFDPEDPSTWTFSSLKFIPSTWGGEVRLYADVENSAAYVQDYITLSPRLSLSPGVRFGRWTGWLKPSNDRSRRFLAVEDQAWEPRLGVTFDLTGHNTLVLKGHWGRYHQNMLAQLFDRVEGGEVFTDEQLWYYRGDLFTDPTTTFTREERERLASEGRFTLEESVAMNETGPVVDYRQPYVDQWIVGLEKTFSGRVKAEAVYANRRNRQMVALLDRNRETNYTVFERVGVFGTDLTTPLDYGLGSVALKKVYLRNDEVRNFLRYFARTPECCVMPPGLTFADTLRLTWNPDYVLSTAPDARREFDQLQFTLNAAFPTWGGSASVVFTSLRGNLDNVTGYDDPAGFGAGPYVRVNESVNSFGSLENYSDRELKLALWGDLLYKIRGGIFWNYATGDHYSPVFTLSVLHYRFRADDRRLDPRGVIRPGTPIHPMMFDSISGHTIFVEERGSRRHDPRASVDFRLEREFPLRGGGGLALTLGVFNLFNFGTVTEVNPSVNRGKNIYYFLPPSLGGTAGQDPSEYFEAVMERVPPRTLRLGTEIRF